MRVTFGQVRVGELFQCNGNLCLKKSTRTAEIIELGRVFYYGQADVCTI